MNSLKGMGSEWWTLGFLEFGAIPRFSDPIHSNLQCCLDTDLAFLVLPRQPLWAV